MNFNKVPIDRILNPNTNLPSPIPFATLSKRMINKIN
jgi:hypothetical protein